MFYCRCCALEYAEWQSFMKHQRFHTDLTLHKVRTCGFLGCKKFFNTENALRIHLFRSHKIHVRVNHQTNVCKIKNSEAIMLCTLESCGDRFENYRLYIKHLKTHIANGSFVTCPFIDCTVKFS